MSLKKRKITKRLSPFGMECLFFRHGTLRAECRYIWFRCKRKFERKERISKRIKNL